MGWLDWLSGAIGTVEHAVSSGISTVEHAIGSGVSSVEHAVSSGISSAEHVIGSGISYVEHLIFPNKNTHIKSGHVVSYQPHTQESSNVYTKYTEVPKHKVNVPNLGLTPTAKKSLEEVKKGVIPPYIPKPEVSSSPTAGKPGVYTPYGYFKNSTDYTKYLIWKTPDVYFPDIFRNDKELYKLYYIDNDYERARELFRKKYSNLIKQAVSNPEIVKGIEWGSITHLKVENGKIIPVNIESEIPPSMRKHWEETHPTIVKHIPPDSIPHPITKTTHVHPVEKTTNVNPPKFGLINTNLVKTANTHVSIPKPHNVQQYIITEVPKEELETIKEGTSPIPALSGILKTVIPIMSVVLIVIVIKKITSEVRV